MPNDEHNGLSRRQWITAAPIGAAGLIASAGAAEARDDGTRRTPAQPVVPGPPAWPFPSALASPRLRGYTYLTAMNRDFFTYDESGRLSTGLGFYAASGGSLFCTFEIPAGAQLRDIEVYGANSTGESRPVQLAYWSADGGYSTAFHTVLFPVTSGLGKVRSEIPEDVSGPFPTATMLVVYFSGTSATFLCNGARLGFTNGGARMGLRAEPIKVFDTTAADSGGRLAANEVRTIVLSSGRLPEGCIGALFRVAVSGASAKGRLKLYGLNATPPEIDALAFGSEVDAVGEVTVALPLSRRVNIVSTRAVHAQVYLVGTVG